MAVHESEITLLFSCIKYSPVLNPHHYCPGQTEKSIRRDALQIV